MAARQDFFTRVVNVPDAPRVINVIPGAPTSIKHYWRANLVIASWRQDCDLSPAGKQVVVDNLDHFSVPDVLDTRNQATGWLHDDFLAKTFSEAAPAPLATKIRNSWLLADRNAQLTKRQRKRRREGGMLFVLCLLLAVVLQVLKCWAPCDQVTDCVCPHIPWVCPEFPSFCKVRKFPSKQAYCVVDLPKVLGPPECVLPQLKRDTSNPV